MLTIERALLIRSIAVLFWAISFGSSAQTNWPNGHTVRVIVPFPGGASTLDSVVRTVTPEISKSLGSPVIVDNKPGAGTVIGVDATAKATDNLTVGGVANSFTVNQSLLKTLPYNTTKDLQPVVLMARTANVLAVKSSLPVNNLKELIDYAKKNPGKLSYASFGNGTTAHFAGEMLKSMAGIYVVHIPYRGQGPALTDLIAGNVDLMFGNLPDFLPYIKSGKIKAIGTTYLTRAPLAPEIPTIAEQGFPTFETDSWYGIVAPSSMTKDAVDRMNLAINKALQDPAVKKNFSDRGIEVIGGSPAKFQEHIQSEILKYERIVKSTKMQSD
ncbi:MULTISPECIES: tripartite tricarboxylate transporter substrate binding protein [unclassified Polynucleobacter]|uniref:Bug family tripartite tricarboxylate transporter substrate binding protein n=1 Tax=unclassified Polynucleobacter TaxID=2640945 RepID=UPI001BFD5998|nr:MULTISPECIES: tripartite tricarboxylate transporter substrate binding protein [unclassified Polynucleobacter]MBU3559700.1 tripartite tricarboxylate transporter substrate binding protein [Polynucleobacter sp. Nonnen-W13]QWE30379.1 tripartite tricarboxylate transporter substrate binding protein [Polynucleobacter sp. Adler-ghost]